MKICHNCRKSIEIDTKIGRRDICPTCHADLHSCLNCAFHKVSAPKQCLEPLAEMIKDKSKGNFCDYFLFAESRVSIPTDTEAEKARKALDDLFKK